MQQTRWELRFEGFFGGKVPLYVSARRRGGAWLGGIGNARGLWNTARYVVDLSKLREAGAKVSGTVNVTLSPDPWTPRGRPETIECALDLAAEVSDAGELEGRYQVRKVSPLLVNLAEEGKLVGSRKACEPPALPDPVTVRLMLEPARDVRRVSFELGLRKGKVVHGGIAGVNARHFPYARAPFDIGPQDVRIDPDGIRGSISASFGGRKFRVDFHGIVVEPHFVGWYALRYLDDPGSARRAEARVPAEFEEVVRRLARSAPAGGGPAEPVGPAKGIFHGDFHAGLDETFRTRFRCDASKATGPVVMPWKSFAHPDPAYVGGWFVAGDLDGDGEAEFVTARNAGQRVTAMIAFKMDGSVLWRWGRGGGADLSFDVPVQLFDLDGDGAAEVYAGTAGSLLVLDGKTGKELRRWPLPRGLGVPDCTTFVDLRGQGKCRDIIVKSRYSQLWAYTDEWKLLWTWRVPPVTRTCHHPTPVDIDGDGKDEIIAGFTLLDHDGKELWTISEDEVKLVSPLAAIREDRQARPFGGHMDDAGVVRLAKRPQDTRLAITFCNGEHLAMLDGRGKVLWGMGGHHFQEANTGWLTKDAPGPQIVSGGGCTSDGAGGVIWLFDLNGRAMGEYLIYGYGRPQALLDWNGDGLMELIAGNCLRVLDGKGRCVARFGPQSELAGEPYGPSPYIGDVDGDQRPEVTRYSSVKRRVWIYKSDKTPKVPGIPIGTPNFTLY